MVGKPTFLAHPRFQQPFIIQCDASGSTIGLMLSQVHAGQLKPIWCRALGVTEGWYVGTDKWLLACYLALNECEIYVLVYSYVIYSDHKS